MISIDFHTHGLKPDKSIQLLNCFAQDLPLTDDGNLYSVGIHPWHLESIEINECLQAMEQAMILPNVVAVGECGIDRAIDTEVVWQEYYFRKQAEMALRFSKPLIIHCVRAYPEVMRMKRLVRTTLPWIIHGFRGNEQTAASLIKNGFYISVGGKLLDDPRKMKAFSMISLDRLFLETDDSHHSINDIYEQAARLLNIQVEDLQERIMANFKEIFAGNRTVANKIKTIENHPNHLHS
ncbi:MAG: TatD family hydrolase [Candidatus Saccharibacteria bacterium]